MGFLTVSGGVVASRLNPRLIAGIPAGMKRVVSRFICRSANGKMASPWDVAGDYNSDLESSTMSQWEKTIIRLNDAHEILSAFGIGPSSRGYQRWRTDAGFRQVDFEDVLNESTNILAVDWRECLQDAIDTVIGQLEELEIEASADLNDEGCEGEIQIDGQCSNIKFVPVDEDDFDQVMATINRLIANKAAYRKFRSCEGSDGWCYAVLKSDDWQAIESSSKDVVDLLFTKVGGA
jgi:hypothetical protein